MHHHPQRKDTRAMRRTFLLIILVALVLSGEPALAAKARSISSDSDSFYHAEHLKKHIGEIGCRATGNYIKAHSKANGTHVIGHLEQADRFILLDARNGQVQIQVTYSDKTSPDSWKGMSGWVDSDYVDCACNSDSYFSNSTYSSLLTSTFPIDVPDGWSHSSGAGAWSTQLRLNPDGSFYGYYHDTDAFTIYESYFNGCFSDIKQTGPYSYTMCVSELQVNGIIGSQYQKDNVQHIITEPAGISNGDLIQILTPGAEIEQLSENHLSWLHGIISNPLSNYALCNITQGTAFDPVSEFQMDDIPVYDIPLISYYCKANNLRVRNNPVDGKIVGHIEKADQFIVLEIVDGWANITVTYADPTSPDSWIGLNGWVSMEFIGTHYPSYPEQPSAWKTAYRKYLIESDNFELTDQNAEFWLAYVDDDNIPELIIDTHVTAGGCYILTYHDGRIDYEIIGSNGITWYIARKNLLLNSAGQQGNYYDDIYSINHGIWDRIYHAENYEYPSQNYPIDQKLIQTYYIGNQQVTENEYNRTLRSYFDMTNAIMLTNGISAQHLLDTLQ